MSGSFNDLMEDLVTQLATLPGIGRRSAERLAYHLLVTPEQGVQPLVEAITALKQGTHHCHQCYNVSDADPCAICADEGRDRSLLCIVESPKDLMKFERSGAWTGLYHVLHGSLSPLDGVDEQHLTLDGLMTRLRKEPIKEVVIATGANLAGEATALHLVDLLQTYPGRVSRLARGLPTGGQLEYASDAMLNDALGGRQVLHDASRPRQGQSSTEWILGLTVLMMLLLVGWQLWSPSTVDINSMTQSHETWWSWPIP